MRHIVAMALILVLTLAGVGRGLAAAGDGADGGVSIAGVQAPICHADGRSPDRPPGSGDPLHHDCCDQCALCAPAILAAPPTALKALAVSHEVGRSAVAVWTLRLARARTPRQSQGPPAT